MQKNKEDNLQDIGKISGSQPWGNHQSSISEHYHVKLIWNKKIVSKGLLPGISWVAPILVLGQGHSSFRLLLIPPWRSRSDVFGNDGY
jgi:hypothetical protein